MAGLEWKQLSELEPVFRPEPYFPQTSDLLRSLAITKLVHEERLNMFESFEDWTWHNQQRLIEVHKGQLVDWKDGIFHRYMRPVNIEFNYFAEWIEKHLDGRIFMFGDFGPHPARLWFEFESDFVAFKLSWR